MTQNSDTLTVTKKCRPGRPPGNKIKSKASLTPEILAEIGRQKYVYEDFSTVVERLLWRAVLSGGSE